jgi:CheY-like chemotaxis protein
VAKRGLTWIWWQLAVLSIVRIHGEETNTVCHVLIIEDEAFIALELEDILIRGGASSVSFAASQEEAIVEARSHRPDVITSDVTLREGTGPEAVKAIRAEMGVIPVVYISALDADWGRGRPMTRSLQKPLNRFKIVSALRDFCGLRFHRSSP